MMPLNHRKEISMKKFYNLFFIVMGLLISGAAGASSTTPLLSGAEYRVGQGDIETAFSIVPRIFRGSAGDDETFSMKVGGNYFITDILAPGLEFDLDTGNQTSIRLLPNLKAYYPLDSRLLPYLQVGFGYAHEFGTDLVAFVIGPGVNYMLSNSVAIGVQFRYDLGAGSETLHEIQLPVQFAIYFKY